MRIGMIGCGAIARQYLDTARRLDAIEIVAAADHQRRRRGDADLVPDIADRDVFLCGPVSMMERVAASLRHLGIPKRQIHVERFA